MEMLTIILVAGVFATLAIPSLNSLSTRNRIVSVTNELLVTHQLARDEAMLRGRTVTACRRSRAASDNATCTQTNFATDPHCSCVTGNADSNADGWEDGWLVFEDRDADGSSDGGEILIQVFEPLPQSFTARGNATHANRVFFDSDGTSVAGSIFVCEVGSDTAAESERIRNARRIRVSRVGAADIIDGTECAL